MNRRRNKAGDLPVSPVSSSQDGNSNYNFKEEDKVLVPW